ncbi:MAG: hypothetical protein DWQ05_10255 [Calditrichaeota bacterium]|nr:MAG: hypothetical protein DWQ05_10255 [Calditrichota bacterium]
MQQKAHLLLNTYQDEKPIFHRINVLFNCFHVADWYINKLFKLTFKLYSILSTNLVLNINDVVVSF